MSGAGRTRPRVVLAVAVAAAVLSTAGLVASTLVRSPQQVLAESQPPPPSLITAEVEHRVLASTLVTRGTVEASDRIEATPATTEGAEVQVVTAVHTAAGEEIDAGDVLVVVSGRPLIALPGRVPAYRDLRPGDSGEDVTQLQEALARLGHYGGPPDGRFGPATKTAVRSLYDQLGYEAPDTGGPGGRGDRPSLEAAAEEVAGAQREVEAMQRRIAAAERADPEEAPAPDPAEEPLADQLRRLQERLAAARDTQADLVAHTGTMMPLSEVVFVPTFPARVAATSAVVGGPVEAPLITVSAGDLEVVARLRTDQVDLVQPGMPVQLVAEVLADEASAVVAAVGPLTSDGAGGSFHPVRVVTDEVLPALWTGADVRVTITSAATEQQVLVVPLSAVSAGADAQTSVSVREPSGQVRRVLVRAGVSGDGFVQVTPIGAGELAAGDQVVVGEQWGR